MSSVNLFTREISLKIVYYGPGLGGKTSSLQYIHRALKADSRGQLVSLATGVDRTLYFDFLPVKLPKLRGYSIRVQLYTVPGQVHYNSTRKLVLTGCDGVVFVADSQRDRESTNVESLENLRENLLDQGQRIEEVPLVLQYNKRDAPDVIPVVEMDARLNPFRAPVFETVATDGRGIFDALKAITARVLNDLRRRGLWDGGSPVPRNTPGPSFGHDNESIGDRLKELSEIEATKPSPATAMAGGSATARLPAMEIEERPSLSISSVSPLPLAKHMPRGPALSELLPTGPARDAAMAVENLLETGDYAQAVRQAARAFAEAAATSSQSKGDDAMLMHALMLGLPGERFLRFREATLRSEAGGASSTDALFALFFLVDAALRR